jgi:hypothetical protein
MPTAPTAFSVVLSHAELAYLLTLFDAAPALGVDHNPLGALDDASRTVAYATARDALRARDLLRLDAADQPLVNDDLLRVLESYAAPHLIVTAYRYVVGEELPLAWFGYRRTGAVVIHTRPGDRLHAFALAPDVTSLMQALADFCAGGALPAPTPAPLTLTAGALAAARAYADAGQPTEVAQVLRAAGLDDDAAAALAAELNNPAAVTAITCVAPGGFDPQRRDAIYWQSTAPSARLIVYSGTDAVRIFGGDEAALQVLINEMA